MKAAQSITIAVLAVALALSLVTRPPQGKLRIHPEVVNGRACAVAEKGNSVSLWCPEFPEPHS